MSSSGDRTFIDAAGTMHMRSEGGDACCGARLCDRWSGGARRVCVRCYMSADRAHVGQPRTIEQPITLLLSPDEARVMLRASAIVERKWAESGYEPDDLMMLRSVARRVESSLEAHTCSIADDDAPQAR